MVIPAGVQVFKNPAVLRAVFSHVRASVGKPHVQSGCQDKTVKAILMECLALAFQVGVQQAFS